MTVTYRNAMRDDLPQVDRVFRTSFCETFEHLYSPENLAAFLGKFTLEAWQQEYDDPAYEFRLAEIDGEAVGYCKLGPLTLPVEAEGPAIELRQLYIVKDHLGTGMAPLLMDWALEEAGERGVRELYLTVYIDNHRAKRFYERYGFVEVGQYDFMVGDQADHDVIMKKAL